MSKIVSIYPVIRLDVVVPDDYEGRVEDEIEINADFSNTKFDSEGCCVDDFEVCGFNCDETTIYDVG